ncbi:MAG: serine hydrolase [Patescibacteria group bacterium]
MRGKFFLDPVKTGKIIILLVLAIFILAGIIFFQTFSGKRENPDQFGLLDPARKFYDKKDLIINLQPLRDELNKIGENHDISIYFEMLNTGANIAINKDAEFWPASLLKVPVSMAVAKKIEKGEWKWSNELVLMSSDKNERFGDLYKKPVGTRITIEELVRRALVDSDNTANFMLVRNLEPAEFQDIYDHIGLTDFMSNDGKISAKHYSVMFRALYAASYLSEENSEKLLEFLAKTPFKEYLGSALPDNVIFSHKIGVSDDKNVFLDSGIVYAQRRPYLLTVMINTGDQEFAKQEMKKISEKIYNYVINYREK